MARRDESILKRWMSNGLGETPGDWLGHGIYTWRRFNSPGGYQFCNRVAHSCPVREPVDVVNLPQFDGHFEKEYTMNVKGVSNEKEAGIFTGV
jgi:hypothetical protein